MSTLSKSPLRVARAALAAAGDALPPYAHVYSPRKFTQPQLFACLVLKTFLKTDYRGVAAHLADHSDLRTTLGLRAVPHFTTLQKASRRLLRAPAARRLFAATVRRFLGRRRRVKRAAFDSTGLDCGHASRDYVRRRNGGGKRGGEGAPRPRAHEGGGGGSAAPPPPRRPARPAPPGRP